MPELPEVQTVVDGLNLKVRGLKIADVWTDYFSENYKNSEQIKNKKYFQKKFKPAILGQKILRAERRAKNIFIHLENGKKIFIHLKMSGHLIYGDYQFKKKENFWEPVGGFIERSELKKNPDLKKEIEKNPTRDSFNKFIHFVLELDNGKFLIMSDLRKFGTIKILNEEEYQEVKSKLGPEPFDLSPKEFVELVRKKGKGRAKNVLMKPEFIAGIGNIYSDEILWEVGVHPESNLQNLSDEKLKEILRVMKKVLKASIAIGGDSMSDFRNIEGRPGKFQTKQKCYAMEGTKCQKKGCDGIIEKKKIGQRIGRFCPVHQKKY